MLTLKNIRKTLGARRILDRVSFSLGEGQKAALVGPNGVGKSTLLRIIGGLEEADRGEILVPNRALMGFLPQEALAEGDETLREYLRRMTGLTELETTLKDLEPRLADQETHERYEALEHEYRRLGGYEFERKARSILDGLALTGLGLERMVKELSGGEKRKAALAGVLLRGVDILLLDEPTNNLDLPALLWLERYLARSQATCLIASHDRRFLDRTVTRVVELDWFKRNALLYTGNWSDYAEMKAHALRRQRELYREQEEERERLAVSKDEKMEWAERVWEKKAPDTDKMTAHYKKERAAKKFHASAKAIETRQKKLTGIEKPHERRPLELSLGNDETAADSVALSAVRFGYERGWQGGPISLQILPGQRIAFLGNNGAGKSTLLRTITGLLPPLQGEIKRGPLVRFAYLMQEHEDLRLEEKVGSFFKRRLPEYDPDALKVFLTKFHFPPDILEDKLKFLSPGERVRLVLALIMLEGAGFLVLDEPTNHLDLESIEALEEALEDFPGSVLLVTHDRRFLENIRLDQLFILEDGRLAPVESYAAYEQGILSASGKQVSPGKAGAEKGL